MVSCAGSEMLRSELCQVIVDDGRCATILVILSFHKVKD